MIAVPFLYFTALALFLLKNRKKIDIAIFICLIYAVSALFGIIAEEGDLFEFGTPNYEITPWSAFLYCFLITVCLLPLITISNLSIKEIKPLKNEKALRLLGWMAIIWFAIYAIGSFSQLKSVLSGDLLALRTALYQGTSDDSFIVSMPFPIRILISTLSFVFGCTWILIFLAFYSLLIQKLPLKYFFFYLIASFSSPWGAVLGIDRSAVASYLISLAGVLIFFWPFMGEKTKKYVSFSSIGIIGVLIMYLAKMTISRFGGPDGENLTSIEDSLIFYLGQSYVYFCYFFDTFDSPDKMTNLIFPFINKYILGDELVGGMRINGYLENKTGESLGLFYTYIGQIQITAGRWIAILFCFLLCFFSYRFLTKLKKGIATPMYAYLYYFFSSFMILGLFAHYYQSPQRTVSVVIFIFFFYVMSRKQIFVKNDAIKT